MSEFGTSTTKRPGSETSWVRRAPLWAIGFFVTWQRMVWRALRICSIRGSAPLDRPPSTSSPAPRMCWPAVLGAFVIAKLNDWVPPLDTLGLGPPGIAAATASVRRIWLFVAAVTLHNFPEGMAVGVSFGGGDFDAGRVTALGIGLQNIPEGLAVAVALTSIGYSRGRAALIGAASGLVEPVAGLIGVSIVTVAQAFLPWGLGLAAGAMIYVVASDIIPDAHARINGGGKVSTGLMIGLAAMMFLDTTFG